MKLIIEIDEEMKKTIDEAKSGAGAIVSLLSFTISEAIKNGTPLPQGHGRLIDADETLKKHCVDLCREKPSCYEDCLIYDLFHLAPTIIEADKENEK